MAIGFPGKASRWLKSLGVYWGFVVRLMRRRFKTIFDVDISAGLKSLQKKFSCDSRTVPQRLKPDVFFETTYGTAEAVPLQSSRLEAEDLKQKT
jgi:hypothetical protein